jgi:hypothetical protein
MRTAGLALVQCAVVTTLDRVRPGELPTVSAVNAAVAAVAAALVLRPGDGVRLRELTRSSVASAGHVQRARMLLLAAPLPHRESPLLHHLCHAPRPTRRVPPRADQRPELVAAQAEPTALVVNFLEFVGTGWQTPPTPYSATPPP